MARIRLGNVKDFSDKNIKTFALLGKKIGVFKMADDGFIAIEMRCKHQGATLMQEEGSFLAYCPRHNWRYDLISGRCINHDSADLTKYPTQIEGDTLYLLWGADTD